MATRKPFVAGNWKMNLHKAEAVTLARTIADAAGDNLAVDLAVFPALTYLDAVGSAIQGSSIKLGAQDCYPQPNGAFTGEVSLSMLQDLGVRVVLTGHSERRHVMAETDTIINCKVRAALDAGFDVILCVGEKIEQRQAEQTDAINTAQINYGLAGIRFDQMMHLTVAYEPIWAIGTGRTAMPNEAQAAHGVIRQALARLFTPAIAESTRIQYGGSVKPANAADLFVQSNIDGGLIGGASLNADDFVAIVRAAAAVAQDG